MVVEKENEKVGYGIVQYSYINMQNDRQPSSDFDWPVEI